MHFLINVLIVVPLSLGIVYAFRRYQYEKAYKKVAELLDCPFKFRLDGGSDGDGYIIFKFGPDIELWCDYNFGIRCDGIYGVSEVKVKGINSAYARALELKIGQSVFPIIDAMSKFDKWAEGQAFDYEWEKSFQEEWDYMKKNLDNLRVLETKSKEKEKKQK